MCHLCRWPLTPPSLAPSTTSPARYPSDGGLSCSLARSLDRGCLIAVSRPDRIQILHRDGIEVRLRLGISAPMAIGVDAGDRHCRTGTKRRADVGGHVEERHSDAPVVRAVWQRVMRGAFVVQ